MDTSRLLASYNYHTPTHQLPVAVDRHDRQTDRQTDRPFILINHSSFAIKMSQPNINTPNSDLVSSLSQSQSYLSPNFLVILPGLTSSVRLCGVERCPAQQSEEEEEHQTSTERLKGEQPTKVEEDMYICMYKLSRMPSLAHMAAEWTSHTDNNAVTVESLATRRSRNNCGHTAKNQLVKTATVRVYTVTA